MCNVHHSISSKETPLNLTLLEILVLGTAGTKAFRLRFNDNKKTSRDHSRIEQIIANPPFEMESDYKPFEILITRSDRKTLPYPDSLI